MGTLPRQADCFQERPEVLAVADALGSGGADGSCQVLMGMGGVGKTQIAAQYARRVWREGDLKLLVWVTAGSRQAVVDAYAQAAATVLKVDAAPAQAANRFMSWLEPGPSSEPTDRWLIVLDDVADPKDLTGLWPPASASGRTIVTTRSRDAALTGPTRRLVRVGLFDEAEAVGYLADALAAHHRTEPRDDLAGLAKDLGYLPLALSQAATYVIDADLRVADYRRELADGGRTLSELRPVVLPDDQTAGVDVVWRLSVDRADPAASATGLARRVLELASVLDPNGIPEDVFLSDPALALLTGARQVSAQQVRETLRLLHRLSLVEHTPDIPDRAVRVHQLVQRYARDGLAPDRRRELVRAAADALVAVWPVVEAHTDLAQVLRANTTALAAVADGALHEPTLHEVLIRAGRSLGHGDQVAGAVAHFAQLADVLAVRLGPQHPSTFTARNNHAYWRGTSGDAAGAAEEFGQLLTEQLRSLGTDHPDCFLTRGNHAFWSAQAGDHESATKAWRELLADRRRVLGADHPSTLYARTNLAHVVGSSGGAPNAAVAFERLVRDFHRVLGPDHPDTLIARSNFAEWVGRAGDASRAARTFADLVPDMVRVLGPEHELTLNACNHLAAWQGAAGDAGGAAGVLTNLLEVRLAVLGPDHPDTLNVRGNLAYWLGRAGDAAAAASGFASLVGDAGRVLGPDHPETVNLRANLAYWETVAEAAGPAVHERTPPVGRLRPGEGAAL